MRDKRPNLSPEQTRMAVQPMPERLKNFDEVALGYTLEQAQAEAERCLNCPDRWCSMHCPAHNYIPEFLARVRTGELEAAWDLLARTNPMMELSGRVCPCEQQCQSHCTRGIKGEPVAIGRLERFVADWHREHCTLSNAKPRPNGRRAAVVGAGPAGLTCAQSLSQAGFQVTVFEKTGRLGGVPAWGIPSFVLPKDILAGQIGRLRPMVEFRTDTELGVDVTLEQLRRDYDAVFVATGAGRPVELSAEGRELAGVVQARDYLTAPEDYKGKSVLVFGGGNTAVDAARTALRNGADAVRLVYRRTREQLPAAKAELTLALEEGAELVELTSPARFLGENGRVSAVECRVMELAPPDYPGGRSNVADSGRRTVLDCDLAVLALGFENDPVPGLPTDDRNRVPVDKQYATALDGVYAGGDAVTGAQTLMKAVAAGKDAAAAIFARLME